MQDVDWNTWNDSGGPNYPHEKVVQFCFRNYPRDVRRSVRALDLGCGSGVHTRFLAREGFGHVTATDISATGVENTRTRLAAEGLAAEVRVEGADALSLAPASIDLVICVGVLECAGPQIAGRAVARVGEVLAAGGRGLFVFASDSDMRVTGDNPWALHGYAEDEVGQLFDAHFDTVWLDRYITTYRGGREQQNDWLVTVENKR